MIIYRAKDRVISLPLPLFVVVEDVGWWQGEDGSARNEPFRNRFPRRHCLADYRALVQLAERLSMRLAIGMVLGEWDRTNLLRDITGATWMGRNWHNHLNQGPWLEETAGYIRDNERNLELAVHGLCHEFWQDLRMQRSEFHTGDGCMRSKEIVVGHLRAYAEILRQNGFCRFPKIFVPPALHHSFGNGLDSIQAVLREFGIDYVTTRFSKARQYSPPVHEKITWECGVTLLERGMSPVGWDEIAARPGLLEMNPILALHWPNLLHSDPHRNSEVVEGWGGNLLAATAGLERILAEDAADCWNQAAIFYLADIHAHRQGLSIKLQGVPHLPYLNRSFSLKITGRKFEAWQCSGARLVNIRTENSISTVRLFPEPGRQCVDISL